MVFDPRRWAYAFQSLKLDERQREMNVYGRRTVETLTKTRSGCVWDSECRDRDCRSVYDHFSARTRGSLRSRSTQTGSELRLDFLQIKGEQGRTPARESRQDKPKSCWIIGWAARTKPCADGDKREPGTDGEITQTESRSPQGQVL